MANLTPEVLLFIVLYFFAGCSNNDDDDMTPDRHCAEKVSCFQQTSPNQQAGGTISTPQITMKKVAVSYVEVAKIAKRKSRNSSLAPMK